MLAVTSHAESKLLEVLQHQDSPEDLVRVAVVRGPHGCIHGWRLGLDGGASAEDTMVSAGSLHLVVESALVPLLEESRIDYVEGPMGIGFVIEGTASEDGDDGGHHCHHH